MPLRIWGLGRSRDGSAPAELARPDSVCHSCAGWPREGTALLSLSPLAFQSDFRCKQRSPHTGQSGGAGGY